MTDYKEIYLASSQAYKDRDIEKMMSFVTEDYSWYNIHEEGPRLLATGPEEASQGMKMVFANTDYISGHVDFLKTFGNILIAVETDTILQNGEEIRAQRMSVYECKEGKLHRTWSFPIENGVPMHPM
jgi:hypothetical protein